MAFIISHQFSIMLFMSGICSILAFLTLITDSLSPRKKSILALMGLSAMLLLLFERLSYYYRGNTSDLGSIMVRLCNGMVFFLSIFIPHLVTQYMKDLLRHEGKLPVTPMPLPICEALFGLGTVLIVVSQFTGLYYTFDGQNIYHRAPGYPLSYIIPFLIVLLQECTLLRYRNRLNKTLVISLMLSLALPTVMSIVQIFYYGASLTSITMGFVVIVFYIYALNNLGKAVHRARQNELEFYKASEKKEAAMFAETAEALANAIDAKDKYTHGHSTRVAALSRQIAKKAGMTGRDCDQVYFAALLHDIGKIGIRDDIINKEGKLTDEEFEQVKLHPILGYQILSSIKQSPSLSIGAHYHHERYDGKGYPDGLRGEEIPEIARIIAVADAYDAMSSSRSYRALLPQETIKEELTRGTGKQFDPKYAEIMLRMMENGET